MNLEQRMRGDLLAAMKERDDTGVRALRHMLGVIGNAEAVDPAEHEGMTPTSSEVCRRILTDDHRRQLLADQISQLGRTASQLRQLRRLDEAVELEQEIAVLASYEEGAEPATG
jgi:uncharacterized protein YqeY